MPRALTNDGCDIQALDVMLDEAIWTARKQIDLIPEDADVSEEVDAIQAASLVPDLVAHLIIALPAYSLNEMSAKSRAHAWLEGTFQGSP